MSAYNSVDGSPATQKPRSCSTTFSSGEWRFLRLRHLRRRRDRRRDGAASHGGEHRHRDQGRVRGRARRRLSVVVAAAPAVSRRVPARADLRLRHRRGGVARAARQVRARAVRASVRRRRQRGATGTTHAEHRALAREAAREVDRAAQERPRRAAAIANARAPSPSSAPTRRKRGSAATAARACNRCRSSTAFASAVGARRPFAYAPGPGRVTREYVVVPAEQLLERRQRTGPCADCTASTSTTIASTGAPRLDAHRRADRFRLDAQLAGPRHSVRLVLGALDGHAHRARDAACDANRRRGERRLSPLPRRQARHRQLAEAARTARRSRDVDLKRRAARTTFASSTSRAPATRA